MNSYSPSGDATQHLPLSDTPPQQTDVVPWPSRRSGGEHTAPIAMTPPVAGTAPAAGTLAPPGHYPDPYEPAGTYASRSAAPAQPQVIERVVYVDRPVVVPQTVVQGTTIGWMGSLLLAALPVIGFIYILVLACGGTAVPDRARWARATLLWMLIGALSVIALVVAGVYSIPELSGLVSTVTAR